MIVLVFLALIVLFLLINGLIMMFIGNISAVSPELIPALSYSETFSLMLPLYAMSLIGGLFSAKK